MGDTTSIVINKLNVEDTKKVVDDLRELFEGAYHDSHMYRDLKEDLRESPDHFRLFLATAEGKPVGAAVVEHKVHENYDYLGSAAVHIKRFVVADFVRGAGLGVRLLDACKSYAFDELGLDVLFGESNEYVALARYGKEGALYRKESIEAYLRRNTPAQALEYFAIDITDPRLRQRRYPNGDGIHFAFPGNDTSKQKLKANGFISQEDVLASLQ